MNYDIRSNEIIIEFNQETFDLYLKKYFKEFPRKRKNPLNTENTIVPSINKWIIISNRIVQNELKKQWGKYAEFVADYYGYKDLGISKCNMNIHIIFGTRTRHDLDNYSFKFINDGLVFIGALVDDSYFVINRLTTTAEYQKDVYKMIVTFSNCEFDKDLLKETQIKEAQKRKKREETMANKKTTKKRTSKKKKQ